MQIISFNRVSNAPREHETMGNAQRRAVLAARRARG